MSANKELLNAAAILAAARVKSDEEVSAETIMEIFDEMYDYLDCFMCEKNDREPFRDLTKRLERFYLKSAEESAKHPRWHQPIDL